MGLDATLQRFFEELHACSTFEDVLSVRYDEYIHGLSPRRQEQVLEAMQDVISQLSLDRWETLGEAAIRVFKKIDPAKGG